MQIMKMGGNQKCQSYLSSNGVLPSTPIKQKYESDVAQLYKHRLKARSEGKKIVLFLVSSLLQVDIVEHILLYTHRTFFV